MCPLVLRCESRVRFAECTNRRNKHSSNTPVQTDAGPAGSVGELAGSDSPTKVANPAGSGSDGSASKRLLRYCTSHLSFLTKRNVTQSSGNWHVVHVISATLLLYQSPVITDRAKSNPDDKSPSS